MMQQTAYDRVGEEIKRRYRDWYIALAEVPSWREYIDAQVQTYVHALQDVVLANLNWRY